MAEPTNTRTRHLSIGEVLALLVEEFPEITISKIRFLESQGLIDPERTPSGYRKFYEDDIELLRCILREQRENYLPLKVIKDRLDSGEIDPTNENPRPRGIKNVPESPEADEPGDDAPPDGNGTTAASAESLPAPPAPAPPTPPTASPTPANAPTAAAERTSASTNGPTVPTGRLSATELCQTTGLTPSQLSELESYGVVVADGGASGNTYGPDAAEIGTYARELLVAGVDARHLRGWRVAAEREAGLFEQLIQPLLRQRNPEANRQAVADLERLEDLGGSLRAVLVRAALRHHHTD